MGSLALLVLPTAILIALGGPYQILYFNALSTHDGCQYFGVSLNPLGATPYCSESFRYSRMLFPTLVFALALAASTGLRLFGLGDWLHQQLDLAGFQLPNYVLVQAIIYHLTLLVISWLAIRCLAAFLLSRRAAVLLVGIVLQPTIFKGLLTPLDLILVTLCLRAIQTWREARPTWWSSLAIAGLFAVALLGRDFFFLFAPVLVACELSDNGYRNLGKCGATIGLGLLMACLWFGLVSAVQGVNLFTEAIAFIRVNSTVWPFEAFPAFLLADSIQAVLLAMAVLYATAGLARGVRLEWKLLRDHQPLSANGLWSLGVIVTFVRAGPPMLSTVGNYGRLLVLAPMVLQDFRMTTDFLATRLGRHFDKTIGLLSAAFLGLLVSYQHALYPAHLARLNQESNFLARSWMSQVKEVEPWLYRF